MRPIPQAHDPSRQKFEATMIQATDVNIGVANLNMTNNQFNDPANITRRYALDLLRSNCSLTALLNANERFDPPRCAEATRQRIIRKMEDWVRHDSPHNAPSSIFWLYGGAGAGKSALAQTLAEKFKRNEDLAATFFFFKADAKRNNGNHLIPTLAHELVRSFRGLAPFVEENILSNLALFDMSRQTQMLELLVEPLTGLSLEETDGIVSNAELKSHPRLVVIDGLDECCDSDIQCDLLRIIASAVPHFPYPLRFLITSRPESHITRAFQHDVGNVEQYNLSNDSDADKDIRKFLDEEFAKIRRSHLLRKHLPFEWPLRTSISSIVERSSGHFIYASTVVQYIQCPRHRPEDRLNVILGLKQPYEKDRPYARLDSLYTLILLEIRDELHQLEKVQCALGVWYLRSLGLLESSQWTSDRHAIEALLELRPGDLVLLFDCLLSLVTFDGDNIRIFHQSLFEYLLDSSRSGDLRLDLGLAHEAAAHHILRTKTQDNWDFKEFQSFAYHCQFARLNSTLKDYFRFLACEPKIVVTESSLLIPSQESTLLQLVLYILQTIGRQDFDSDGHCYRKYVDQTNRCLLSAVPWGERLTSVVSGLTRLRVIQSVETEFRSSFKRYFACPDVQHEGTNGFDGRTPIPAVNGSVIESIRLEHEMFSSYVKAYHRYPYIVVTSFLEPSAELIHSCHIVVRSVSVASVAFVMLVAYTQRGVRLSCTKFDDATLLPIDYFVEEHMKNTQKEVDNNHLKVYCGRPEKDPLDVGLQDLDMAGPGMTVVCLEIPFIGTPPRCLPFESGRRAEKQVLIRKIVHSRIRQLTTPQKRATEAFGDYLTLDISLNH